MWLVFNNWALMFKFLVPGYVVWNFKELRFAVFSHWLRGSRLSNSICLTFSILGFMVPDCLEFPIHSLIPG